MQNIKINLEKIEYVVHIGDIHIRLLNRHKEYREVFEKLYSFIRTTPKNTIVYVGGDIVHSKTNLTPELVLLASEFLLKLSSIRPTVLIAGNHDANLKNKNRLDSITPIIDILKENNSLDEGNLIYLKNSGLYQISNCLFSVMSVFDSPDTYDLLENFTKPQDVDYTIGCFHGVVNGAMTDVGHKLESNSVNKHAFRNFDYTFLADIHAQQYFNEKKTIAYCGSLIQQNHGEIADKGFLFWNLKDGSSEYILLPNDYGYHTITITSGKMTSDVSDICKKPYLRILSEYTTKLELDEIISNIKQQYDVQEIVVKTDKFTKDSEKKITDFNIENFYDEEYRLKIIVKYIKEFYPNEKIDLDLLSEINKGLSTQLMKKDYSSFKWIPVSFEFSNMFSFGEDNRIDFNNINGIYGLFGNNYKGKSSVIESLIYCIFDKCPKTGKSVHVLNSNKESFECKFTFLLNDELYTIHRIGKKNKATVKVDVDFYKENESGEIISLNGDQRASTNNIIRNYLGTYDDFILTTISSQSRTPEFADKTQSERKTILSSFLNIEIFDSLYEISNDELKEVKSQVKYYNIQNIIDNKLSDESIIEEAKILLDNIKLQKEEHVDSIKKQKDEIKDIEGQLIPINPILLEDSTEKINKAEKDANDKINNLNRNIESNNISVDKFKNNIQVQHTSIDSTNSEIKSVELEKDTLNDTISSLENSIKNTNRQEINDKINYFNDLYSSILKLRSEISVVESSIKLRENAIKHLDNISYDEQCSYCITNVNKFTGNAITYRKELPDFIANLKELNSVLLSKQEEYKEKEKYDMMLKECDNLLSNLRDNKHKKDSLDIKIESLRNKIDSANNNITTYINNIVELERKNVSIKEDIEKLNHYIEQDIFSRRQNYEKVKQDAIHNNTVRESIKKRTEIIEQLQDRLNEISDLHGQVISKIQLLEQNLKTYQIQINEYSILERKLKSMELYVKSVHRDGLPYKIINDILPVIENNINTSLSYITDFSINLVSTDNNVDGYIIRQDIDKYPFELASGFERTIISMAFRIAMIEISNLSKAAFLVYDEGFGTMDSENIQKLNSFFELLKMKFDFVIVISHIDSIKDIVDNYYEVDRINGYSYIEI